MSTIAVILVNVSDMDEYIGNISDEEFDRITEEYIREEVSRGNFLDTRIRYMADKETTVCVSTTTEMVWSKMVNDEVVDLDGVDESP